jgi:tetratricopeptide (TPR) repeat protein
LRGRSYVEIVPLAISIARSLAAIHEAGDTHGDLKPQNVLLGDAGPLLTDFLIDAGSRDTPIGSPYSMSPQQRSGSRPTAADDIYGFGALLFELLAAYPPHYPGNAEESHSSSAPRSTVQGASVVLGNPHENLLAVQLHTLHPMPDALHSLLLQCLAATPEARPASMHNVAIELERIVSSPAVTDPTDKSRSDDDANRHDEPIALTPPPRGAALQVAWQRPGTQGAASDLQRAAFRRGVTVAAAIGLVILAAIVFFLLPDWVSRQRATSSEPVHAAAPLAAAAPEVAPPLDYKQLAELKQQAEDKRVALDEQMKKLAERAAKQWAIDDFAKAQSSLHQGDEQLAAREYAKAIQQYDTTAQLLTQIEKAAPAALATALREGDAAFNAGQAVDAQRAFELALKIDLRNVTASARLKRVQNLDRVLAMLSQAQDAERGGEFAPALQHYLAAAQLDPQNKTASDGAERMRARVAGDQFSVAMAHGFTALASKDFTAARDAFEAAGRVRANAPEVSQALQQVEQEERTRTIESDVQQALVLERSERWKEARDLYQHALQLDGTIVAAQQGEARVTPRVQLNEELELYISQPERLFSSPVRSAARQTLDRAAAIEQPGPQLIKQIAMLRGWLAKAGAPVSIALQSDNQTQVTIYRVGELGNFEHRSVDLAPGSYTVVGTRPGYRDVRRELKVQPGQSASEIDIRCEEKI